MPAEDKPMVEVLDVDNYATWSIRMRALLISKGLWAAVESSTPSTEGDGCLHGQCVAGDFSQCLAPVMCQPIMSHVPCQHLCLHCSLTVSASSSITSFYWVGVRDTDSGRASNSCYVSDLIQ